MRSLCLMTGDLDATLPGLPNLEILEHQAWTLGDCSVFARFPRLRRLWLHVAAPDGFRAGIAGPFEALEALEDLTITGLPSCRGGRSTGIALVVTSVDLRAPGTLWLDGALPPSARVVRLTATAIAGHAPLPANCRRWTSAWPAARTRTWSGSLRTSRTWTASA